MSSFCGVQHNGLAVRGALVGLPPLLLPVIDRLLVLHGGKFIVDGPRDLVMAKLQGTGNTAG